MLGAARKAGQRPAWIGENIWEELRRQWATPEYRERSEKAKQNRASDCGGLGTSLHTGGSIPHTEHRRRLKQKLGREPTMAELHARTHKRQNDQGWVDQRSQHTQEEYQRVVERRRRASELGESSGIGSQTDPSDFAAWEEAAGGRNKDRVYGIGSVAQVSASSYSSCSVESASIPSSESALMSQKLDVLASSFQAYMEKQEARYEAQCSQIELLLGHIRPQGEASAAPPSPVTEPVDEVTESDHEVE